MYLPITLLQRRYEQMWFPGLDSCVAAALDELDPCSGAVCFPALQQRAMRHAPGLAHLKQTPRYGDAEAMLRALDQQRSTGVFALCGCKSEVLGV